MEDVVTLGLELNGEFTYVQESACQGMTEIGELWQRHALDILFPELLARLQSLIPPNGGCFMAFRKCFLLATTFILLLVGIIATVGTDRVALASPNEQSDTSTPELVNVLGSDPREYTVEYVDRAIELYDQRGLEAMKEYYNSADSFEGEWYLFAIDANDIYIVHPLFPRLIGTDIKDVVDSTGYELGKDIAKATEEGRWIEYLWPHPVTLAEVPKVSYAKRYDGYIFASGYYPVPGDPAEYTKNYVQKAIDLYDSDGLIATVAQYNSRDSLDNQWYLVLADVAGGTVLAHGLRPDLAGTNVTNLLDPEGFNIGEALLAAPENGYWFQIAFFSSLEAGFSRINVWAIQHDGLVFASGYFAGVLVPPTPTPVPPSTVTPAPFESAIENNPFKFLIAVLNEARDSGSLSDMVSELLANLFIDNLITPHTGETREEVRHRLVAEGPRADWVALVALYNATDGLNWDKSDNWLSDQPLSKWYGVTTNVAGRVTELELYNNNLTGTLPAELGNLTNLTDLNLRGNSLRGRIPPELGNLSNLERLYLYRTELSGEIPRELANLTNLESLLLYSNDLSGTIPAWLDELTNLKRLDLDYNNFTGNIPPELGNLTELEVLWLSENNLSGEIPPELGNLAKLRLLMFYDNGLSGEIPPELGNLSSLELMYLHENDLSGEIPAALGDLDRLERLYLQENNLSGEIPAALGDLDQLEVLYLHENSLSGEIPAALGNLDQLEVLHLRENNLSGPIPHELGNLSNLRWLALHENELTGPIPHELGNLSNLRYMFLRNNQLTGPIPYELGNLSKLEILSIRNNMLTGMIPAELGRLANLEGLTVSDNELFGTIPSELGNLSNLETLYISGNRLSGCIPAELRDVSDNDFEDLDPALPFCGSEQTSSGVSSNTGISAEDHPMLMPVKVIEP